MEEEKKKEEKVLRSRFAVLRVLVLRPVLSVLGFLPVVFGPVGRARLFVGWRIARVRRRSRIW